MTSSKNILSMAPVETQGHIIVLREKIQANKDLMLKTPSYDTARTIQNLTRELNAAAAAYRKKNIHLAYNFEHNLLERLVA